MNRFIAVALLALLGACSGRSVECADHEDAPSYGESPEVDDANNVTGIIAESWIGRPPPYRVFFADPAIDRTGMEYLNGMASGDMLVETTEREGADLVIEIGDPGEGMAGITYCPHYTYECTIVIKEARKQRADLMMHEFMHALGYASVHGDVHDPVGFMFRRLGDDRVFSRAQAFVRALWATRETP